MYCLSCEDGAHLVAKLIVLDPHAASTTHLAASYEASRARACTAIIALSLQVERRFYGGGHAGQASAAELQVYRHSPNSALEQPYVQLQHTQAVFVYSKL